MRGLPVVEGAQAARTRRWDALVLGGALPGLICAVLLAMRRLRVLVVEEASATRRFPGMREPFWMGGADREGVLGGCLRAMALPLIDQRRFETDPIALQVVCPEARVDVGRPALTADEWVAWGLAKPEEARSLARALGDAAAAERQAMLDAPLFRAPRRRTRGARWPTVRPTQPPAQPRRHTRGLPSEALGAPTPLGRILSAQVRALSNLGASPPSPESQARLLGAPLEGAALLLGGDPFLGQMLRRRLQSLYAEFRTLPGDFRLVSAGGHPAVEAEPGDVWSARALILNAPRQGLAAAMRERPPSVLRGPAAAYRRRAVHLRVERDGLPDAMCARLVRIADDSQPPDGTNAVCMRTFSSDRRGGAVDLVASAVVREGGDGAADEAAIEASVAGLLPLCGDRLTRVDEPAPRWDHDDLLADPPAGGGWPEECELRMSSRQVIHHLDRSAVAGLGSEGDVLLGWRAGDAIAADLA